METIKELGFKKVEIEDGVKFTKRISSVITREIIFTFGNDGATCMCIDRVKGRRFPSELTHKEIKAISEEFEEIEKEYEEEMKKVKEIINRGKKK